MKKEKLLIIGASSYLGVRLFFDLKKHFKVVGTFSSNRLSEDFIHLDITDKQRVENVIGAASPDIIIHVANNSSAKWCDANPDKAILLKQTAMAYIVRAANTCSVRVIYISMMGAIDQTNHYGKTKHESEKIIKRTKAGYLVFRPSLILGFNPNTTNGRPFNRLFKNLDGGVDAVYDASWKFQPTYVGHISEVIRACIEKNVWNRVITIAVPEMKSRFDTTKDILSLLGITVAPVDNQDTTLTTFKDHLTDLKKYKLPIYTYSQMIQYIHIHK